MKSLVCLCVSALLVASTSTSARAQNRWLPYGPDGGDARAFAIDPHDHQHIFLGTLTGTIFDSHDGGSSWKRVARLDSRDDLALDNIVVDPNDSNHLLVGAWVLDRADGGLYVSNDGGKTWKANEQMKGHSIRALTIAPSDPKILVIGALDGVFRSTDAGKSWTLISPAGNAEIHEVESIAIDPKDPRTIFAGTWHLPWKTTDGGEHWANIGKPDGLIDDSDVFSIIIDQKNPQNLYLSACSGIYRSLNEGGISGSLIEGKSFEKVKGIPTESRRTRVLMQDPTAENTVYAGTTNGLWKTTNSGHTFTLHGDPNYIINDVSVDPQNTQHVLLATDRNGVLLSEDGGLTFKSANSGFSARQISAITQDRSNPSTLYVGVINDKAAGGMFASNDGGLHWQQQSAGLNGADIFSLGETPGGTLLAGTRHGIFRLTSGTWSTSGLTLDLPPEEKAADKIETSAKPKQAARARAASNAAATKEVRSRPSSVAAGKGSRTKHDLSVSTAPTRSASPQQSSTGVYAIASNSDSVFAATEEGLLVSKDEGNNWNRIRSANGTPWRVVTAQGDRVAVADLKLMALSTDKGVTFTPISAPAELTIVSSMALDNTGHLWVGGREGVYVSDDNGANWHTTKGLFVPNTSGIYFDQASSRVLVTSSKPGTIVFAVHEPDMAVNYWEAGWTLRQVRPVGDHLVGVTPYDGLVLQPRMVDSPELKAQR